MTAERSAFESEVAALTRTMATLKPGMGSIDRMHIISEADTRISALESVAAKYASTPAVQGAMLLSLGDYLVDVQTTFFSRWQALLEGAIQSMQTDPPSMVRSMKVYQTA